jgi:transcriptional regulator with XRE-family HTH domain
MELKEKLKFIRQTLGLTQIEMGSRLGVTMTTYRWWEQGAMKPRFDRQEKIEEMYKDLLAEQKREVA